MKKLYVFRGIALVVLISLLSELFYPVVALAVTGGPVQAEFTNFESVSTTEMVDPFTGNFTYNLPVIDVPGPHGSGYAMSLSYHSNMSPEDDASWVGYGWALSPGSITRFKKGIPDDHDNADTRFYHKTIPNKTWTAGAFASGELAEHDVVSLGGSLSLRHNNYKGWSLVAGFFTSVKGLGSLGLNSDDEGGASFSMRLNPYGIASALGKCANNNDPPTGNKDIKTTPPPKEEKSGFQGIKPDFSHFYIGSTISLNSATQYQSSTTLYHGDSWDVSPGVQIQAFLGGATLGLTASNTVISTVDKNGNYESNISTYGYMYSGHAMSDDYSIMDYSVEKDKPFNVTRNSFLPIPYSGADEFIVRGEGTGGVFRLRQNQAGSFRPNSVNNVVNLLHVSPTLVIGGDWGLSGTIGTGSSEFAVSAWNISNNSEYSFLKNGYGTDEEPYCFRFHNDPGGSVEFASSDEALGAWIGGTVPKWNAFFNMNNGRRDGRAHHIGYHTNAEMEASSGGALYKSYNKDNRTGASRSLVDRNNGGSLLDAKKKATFASSIGEFALDGENGNRYVYGLPVYGRNEVDMSYGVEESPVSSDAINHGIINKYDSPSHQPEQIIGEVRENPYAATYLLTEITTPDYGDRTNNGPTDDDFGGYTRFSYNRAYGSTNKIRNSDDQPWYKWRMPYNGLTFQRSMLSDPRFNTGAVSYGEKEVYYMQTVETKTHIAFFVTNKTDVTVGTLHLQGSGQERLDGFEATHDEATAANGSGFPAGSSNLQYLEQILLYAKNPDGTPGKLLKKVHFAYDYSLMTGCPNSRIISGSARYGKLTLKRVWAESEGVYNANISPYQFQYSYPTSYPAPYTGLVSPLAASGLENPAYKVSNIDCWGGYRADGDARIPLQRSWINQNASSFDPAAWHLKVIKLPSGGEIHVQYEQKDYTYVQNRPAMAMVSLDAAHSNDDAFSGAFGDLLYNVNTRNKFYLNYGELGLSSSDLSELADKITEQFITKKEKIFFKFYYGTSVSSSSLSDGCQHEYMVGYANVYGCGVDGTGLWVKLGASGSTGVVAHDQPLKVACDFKHSHDPGCNESDVNESDREATVKALLSNAGTYISSIGAKMSAIPALSPSLSYLRIPLTRAKKGGGVRVKRILMYNPAGSLETSGDDEALYGTEYLYETFESGKKISSGVATNEPSMIRQENALVKLLDDNTPEVVAGESIIHCEGPLGENLLPAPSVGYSRVIIRNIHQGLTNSGFSMYEFNTAKEHPCVEVSRTGLEPQTKKNNPIMTILQISEQEISETQGYAFHINHIHGAIKSMSKYGGLYNTSSSAHSLATAVSSSPTEVHEYEYFPAGEAVPVMYGADRPLRYEHPGQETEVVFETRHTVDYTNDHPWQGSIAVNGTPWWLMVGIFPYIYQQKNTLDLHVTNKIIDNPLISRSVTTTHDGIYNKVENIAFNPQTGAPVLTYTTDGYDKLTLPVPTSGTHAGSYYTYTFPADQTYAAMGPRTKNERYTLKSFNANPLLWSYPNIAISGSGNSISSDLLPNSSSPLLTFSYGGSSVAQDDDKGKLLDIVQTLTPGDLVELRGGTDGATIQGVFYLGDVDQTHTTATVPYITYKLLDPSYGSSPAGSSSMYSLSGVNTVNVIRSARANQLNASATVVSTYGRNVDAALQYAKTLQTRQAYADKLNDWIHNGEGEEVLDYLWYRNLTWDPPPAGSANFDIMDDINLPFNPVGTNANRYFLKLKRTGGTVSLGWWDNKKAPLGLSFTHDWYNTSYKQNFDYTGKEMFGINDYGELVYYTFVNGRAEARNVNYRFRVVTLLNTPLPVHEPHPIAGLFDPDPARVNAFDYSAGNIIAAQAQTFSDQWYDGVSASTENVYERTERGKWRGVSSYAYRSTIFPGSDDGAGYRNYNAGIFLLPDPFDPHGTNNTATWLRLGTAKAYSTNGNLTEQDNALSVTSATVFSYGGNAPVLTANNATRGTVSFQSFEDVNSVSPVTTATAHTGKKSIVVGSSTTYTHNPHVSVDGQIRTQGMQVRFWIKKGASVTEEEVNTGSLSELVATVKMDGTTLSPVVTRKIARTGEWSLFEIVVPTSSITSGGNGVITLELSSALSGSARYHVDDIRVQPLDAVLSCYVYEANSLRLLTVLDDQHFGLTYQYDMEGKPVRTIKETVRGYQTVQEAIAHVPKRIARSSINAGLGNEGSGGAQTGSYTLRAPAKQPLSPNDIMRRSNPAKMNGKFDLLEMQLSPDKKKLKLFGRDSVPDFKAPFKKPELLLPHKNILPKTDSLNLPAMDKMPSIKQNLLPDSLKKNIPLNEKQRSMVDSVNTVRKKK